ncbi:MAG TPA: hypothetical protein VGV10_02220 [Thermoleophilaceae bacterium]|nr:hypothetical protein [Thermoleophilaceae bacterium]
MPGCNADDQDEPSSKASGSTATETAPTSRSRQDGQEIAVSDAHGRAHATAANTSEETVVFVLAGPRGATSKRVKPRSRARLELEPAPGRYRASLRDPRTGQIFQSARFRVPRR